MRRCLITFCLFLVPYLSHANEPPVIEDWHEYVPADYWDDFLSDKASNFLFKAVDKLRLRLGGESLRLELSIHRRILRNAPNEETYTVIDQIHINPSAQRRWNLWGFERGSLSAYFGGSAGLMLQNIQQVEGKELESLPSVEEMEKGIRESPWFGELQNQALQSIPIDAGGLAQFGLSKDKDWAQLCPFPPEDAENRARWCNLINRITFPFRFPFKAEGLKNLADGEILSYNLNGSLGFGLGASWSLVPHDLIGVIRANIGFGVYLKGEYQMLVQKESEQYARIKVTEVDGHGQHFSAGVTIRPRILDGIFLLEKLDGELTIIPFEYRTVSDHTESFELSYRYDMSRPEAREAYEAAVLGDLIPSSRLAFDKDGNYRSIDDSGVERIFTEETKRNYEGEHSKVRVAFVFDWKNSTNYSNVDVIWTTKEGVKKRFSSISENTQQWKAVFAYREKLLYRFSVLADITKWEEEPEADVLRLVVEGQIRDTRTFSSEMMNYILEVEDSLGQYGLFFRPPKRLDESDEEEESVQDKRIVLPSNSLGPSHFYYTFTVPPHLIDRFINTTEAQRWRILEKAFHVSKGSWESAWDRFWYKTIRTPLSLINVPLYLAGVTLRQGSNIYHAERIEKRWRKIGEPEDIKEKASRFGRMFFDRFYSYELIRVVRALLNTESVTFRTHGRSKISDFKMFEGESQLQGDNIASQKQAQADKKEKRPYSCIKDIQLLVENGVVMLDLDLYTSPQAMFFSLFSHNPGDQRRLKDLLFFNHQGRFQSGRHRVKLTGKDWEPMISLLNGRRSYLLEVSCNEDARSWGQVLSLPFRYKMSPSR